MLNEIGEYEQYTLSPQEIAACQNLRLKFFTLIKRDFSGLERALTIVARHFLSATEADPTELKEILKAWCGFRNAATTELPPHFNGWLVTYIRRAFLAAKIKLCSEKIVALKSAELRSELTDLLRKIPLEGLLVEEARTDRSGEVIRELEIFKSSRESQLKPLGNELIQIIALLKALSKLGSKNKSFSKSLFGALNAKGEIPFRAITYDRIIANAILAGKLRRYYLTCDADLFAEKKILKGTRTLLASDADMVLKMTAEYLLKRRHNAQEFVETNDSNIMNWLKGTRKPENFARDDYVFAQTGENVFELRKVNLGGINALKIKIHSNWTKHFSLVEDVNDAEISGRIFFSDAGSSEVLRKNVKY